MRCSLVPSELRAPLPSFISGLLLVLALFLALSVLTAHANVKQDSAPVWTDESGLRNQAIEALKVLDEAPQHGMPASRYATAKLSALTSELATNEPLFNELLSAALETYAIDLVQGLQPSAFKDRRDPKHSSRAKHTVSSQLQAAVIKGLHRAIATNRVMQFIRSIEPTHHDYQALQAALHNYRLIAERGGWPQVPRNKSGSMLSPGDIDPRVADLRNRLAVTNPGVETAQFAGANAQVYDQNLEEAVMRFQRNHGLKADGKVGKSTRAALNVSADERVEQIKLNLDRWRLMPKRMPANHIWVNVPQFEMRLQLEKQNVLDMRVVVGKTTSPTPMMHDRLEHLVFSPYWHLPQNIAVGEILPKAKADPDYMQANNYEVLENNVVIDSAGIDWQSVTPSNFNYRFRQRPGNWNSLGKVKFIFPNNYAVYLHDTNSKNLFDKPVRAFSHGCVRLEDPEALAAALLEWDRGWKQQKVSRAMASRQQKYVKLGQTVPVYLVYFTATVKDGALQFHNDLYGHDKRHTAQWIIAQENSQNSQVAKVIARYEQSLAQHAENSIQPQLASADSTARSAANAHL